MWVEDLNCCGKPFVVGESVRWDLYDIDAGWWEFLTATLGADTSDAITHTYLRHESYEPVSVVNAVVRSIKAVAWDWPYLGRDSLGAVMPPTPSAVFFQEQRTADSEDRIEGRTCNGYLVELQIVTGEPSA